MYSLPSNTAGGTNLTAAINSNFYITQGNTVNSLWDSTELSRLLYLCLLFGRHFLHRCGLMSCVGVVMSHDYVMGGAGLLHNNNMIIMSSHCWLIIFCHKYWPWYWHTYSLSVIASKKWAVPIILKGGGLSFSVLLMVWDKKDLLKESTLEIFQSSFVFVQVSLLSQRLLFCDYNLCSTPHPWSL